MELTPQQQMCVDKVIQRAYAFTYINQLIYDIVLTAVRFMEKLKALEAKYDTSEYYPKQYWSNVGKLITLFESFRNKIYSSFYPILVSGKEGVNYETFSHLHVVGKALELVLESGIYGCDGIMKELQKLVDIADDHRQKDDMDWNMYYAELWAANEKGIDLDSVSLNDFRKK